ncbi:hypothetical protein, partial [Streptomyces ossamyceticus]|uniref:hypothetical protein n=1 Tax=Streptomyces ossamyceticus TaxID=249581 RepID=UPI001F0AD1E8
MPAASVGLVGAPASAFAWSGVTHASAVPVTDRATPTTVSVGLPGASGTVRRAPGRRGTSLSSTAICPAREGHAPSTSSIRSTGPAASARPTT